MKLNLKISLKSIVIPALVTLVTLKLAGVITWSWWLVFSPLWGAYALIAIGWLLVLGVVALVAITIPTTPKSKIHITRR